VFCLQKAMTRHLLAAFLLCASYTTADELTIIREWKLPSVLKEVSGIAWQKKDRIACVQDETGTIFIYNTANSQVEKEIFFTSNGDFEGIALVKKTAWVLRADGTLFEVQNYLTHPVVKEHSNFLSRKQNIEGLCYDKKHRRLLLAVKSRQPGSDDFKGIYAFSLSSKVLSTEPVIKIDLNNPIFGSNKGRKTFRPSEICFHPRSGDLYVLDGEDPRLLVMSANGKKYKKLYDLSAGFPLPEGLTFTPKGTMYVSSEGKRGAGKICEVSVK
jgi:uncharacterized protein YjiK